MNKKEQTSNLRTLAKTIDGGVIYSIDSNLTLDVYYEDGSHKLIKKEDYDSSFITSKLAEYKDVLILYYKQRKPKVFHNKRHFRIKEVISTGPVELLEVYFPGSNDTAIISPYMSWYVFLQ